MNPSQNTIAVLGTGTMGAPMAQNLHNGGFEVRVWNRTRHRAQPLAQEGIAIADDPAQAADGADFVLTMLADADAVVQGVHSALSTMADGGVWIQSSTVGIEGQKKLEQLADRSGVSYVDAPVLGTREPAEEGQLVVLASGPEGLRRLCSPVFEAIGGKTVWLGEAGAGSRMKVVVNNWLVGLVGVLGETVALARATGADPQQFLQIIEGGPLGAPYARLKGDMMIEEEFPASFAARLARKDTGLVMEAARRHGLPAHVARAVAGYFDEAISRGHGDDDMAAIVEGMTGTGV